MIEEDLVLSKAPKQRKIAGKTHVVKSTFKQIFPTKNVAELHNDSMCQDKSNVNIPQYSLIIEKQVENVIDDFAQEIDSQSWNTDVNDFISSKHNIS